MKLLLGSLLLAGVCWLGATTSFTPMANFNSQRVSGDWHPVANIVVVKQFPQYTLTALPNGDLSYSFKYLNKGKCMTKRYKFVKQGNPAKLKTTTYTTVQILDTDYETYIISYVERGTDAFLTLATKEQTMSSDMQTKFRNFASAARVTGEIVTVAAAATCTT